MRDTAVSHNGVGMPAPMQSRPRAIGPAAGRRSRDDAAITEHLATEEQEKQQQEEMDAYRIASAWQPR